MQLKLDVLNNIPANYPAVWYRVTDRNSGRFIADFTTEAEAVAHSYASRTGKRYDDSVAMMRLSGR